MAYTLFGLLYVLWLFNFITKIVYLTPRSSTGQLTGQFYVLYLIAVTKFADMALDEKVNALDKKVKALFEKEQATLSAGTTATGVQGQTPDPAQVTAERDRTIQQFRALIPNPSQVTAGDPPKQERPARRQLGPEDLQRKWQQNLDKAKMSGKAVFPAAEAGSPIASPAAEAALPSPSPTPE